MPPHTSTSSLLALHAVRLTGVATPESVSQRFGEHRDEVSELLADFEAYGWVSQSYFGGSGGYSLTPAGRAADERMLAEELAQSGAGAAVRFTYDAFLPLNARFLAACTRWQIRPVRADALAVNDHTDFRWDDRTLDELGTLGRRLGPLADQAAAALARFDGYSARYRTALQRAEAGDGSYVDGVGVDSCHTVWFELHEDLLSTLGLSRGSERPAAP